MSRRIPWSQKYGDWALVAGASEGLGAAFAHALAARGSNLILVARRPELLRSTADAIRAAHSVTVETRVLDLAAPELAVELGRLVEAYEVGVGIYNAAYAPSAPSQRRPSTTSCAPST